MNSIQTDCICSNEVKDIEGASCGTTEFCSICRAVMHGKCYNFNKKTSHKPGVLVCFYCRLNIAHPFDSIETFVVAPMLIEALQENTIIQPIKIHFRLESSSFIIHRKKAKEFKIMIVLTENKLFDNGDDDLINRRHLEALNLSVNNKIVTKINGRPIYIDIDDLKAESNDILITPSKAFTNPLIFSLCFIHINKPEKKDKLLLDIMKITSSNSKEVQSPALTPERSRIEGSSIVSVLDPITSLPIRIPVKGNHCKHSQCFDLENYLILNAMVLSSENYENIKNFLWRCVICKMQIHFCEVIIDDKMTTLIRQVREIKSDPPVKYIKMEKDSAAWSQCSLEDLLRSELLITDDRQIILDNFTKKENPDSLEFFEKNPRIFDENVKEKSPHELFCFFKKLSFNFPNISQVFNSSTLVKDNWGVYQSIDDLVGHIRKKIGKSLPIINCIVNGLLSLAEIIKIVWIMINSFGPNKPSSYSVASIELIILISKEIELNKIVFKEMAFKTHAPSFGEIFGSLINIFFEKEANMESKVKAVCLFFQKLVPNLFSFEKDEPRLSNFNKNTGFLSDFLVCATSHLELNSFIFFLRDCFPYLDDQNEIEPSRSVIGFTNFVVGMLEARLKNDDREIIENLLRDWKPVFRVYQTLQSENKKLEGIQKFI